MSFSISSSGTGSSDSHRMVTADSIASNTSMGTSVVAPFMGMPSARRWLAELGESERERLEDPRVERWLQRNDGELHPLLAQRSRGCDGGAHVSVVDHRTRQEDLARISPQLLAVGMENVPLAGELLWRHAEEAPMLSEAGGRAEGALLSVSPDDD